MSIKEHFAPPLPLISNPVSDILYDTLHVTMLLKSINAFQVFYSKHLITRWHVAQIEYTIVKIIDAIKSAHLYDTYIDYMHQYFI